MSEEKVTIQKQEPVWVIKGRCKSCEKCVRICPAGVLGMAEDVRTISGTMISVDQPEYCIGCFKCENACPDFAICVAEKKEFPFAKLSEEMRARQEKILANKCQSLPKDTTTVAETSVDKVEKNEKS